MVKQIFTRIIWKNFLNIAEELDLKGLNRTQIQGNEETQKQHNKVIKRKFPSQNDVDAIKHEFHFNSSQDEGQIGTDTTVALPKEEFTGNMNKLDDKIRALVGREKL